MKKLLKLLGLSEDATPQEIAEKAVTLLNAVEAAEKQIAESAEAIKNIEADLKVALTDNDRLQQEIGSHKDAYADLVKINNQNAAAAAGTQESEAFIKLVAEKRAAGLPRETAEEAARNQIEADTLEAAKAKKEKS